MKVRITTEEVTGKQVITYTDRHGKSKQYLLKSKI